MKVAIITGANRGIGKSAALSMSKRGAGVILTYNNNSEEAAAVVAEIKKSGGKAAALKLDVTQTSTFEGFATLVEQTLSKEWGQKTFDYLVNNAGIAQRTLIKDLTEEQFDQLVGVHFKGPFFLTKKLIPIMNEGGHVVNISSGLAHHAYPSTAVYGSLKGAIEVLTKYIAKEFADKKIRCNTVAPGALDTDFGGGRTDEARKYLAQQTAIGRIGVADDIGPLIAGLLLSEDFRWVDGQTIHANGGAGI